MTESDVIVTLVLVVTIVLSVAALATATIMDSAMKVFAYATLAMQVRTAALMFGVTGTHESVRHRKHL